MEVVLLYRALDELSASQREAVVLFEISGLSLEEVREIQGGSLSGVKSRISRGRQRLAELLGATDTRTTAHTTASNGSSTSVKRDVARIETQLIYSDPQING